MPSALKSDGENRPSLPNITALPPCSESCCLKTCALAASCHGRKTTSVSAETLLTSAEKSLYFWLTESRVVATPPPLRVCSAASARPVEYEVWSSMIMTFLAFRFSIMYLASCGPCTSSRETTRKKVGRLPSVSVVLVAEPDTKPRLARVNTGPTASTSWLPAGPTPPTIASLERE